MQVLASKYIYPKDQKNLEVNFLSFNNLKVQLSFFQKRVFKFKSSENERDLRFVKYRNSYTVYASTLDVFDREFIALFNLIKKIYNVKIITIHPQKGDFNLAFKKFKDLPDEIKSLDLILAYENFPSNTVNRKWIYDAKDMYDSFNFSFLKITFDIAYFDNSKDCISKLNEVYDKVKIIHLSDSKDKKNIYLFLGGEIFI